MKKFGRDGYEETPEERLEARNNLFRCKECGRLIQTGTFDADKKKQYKALKNKDKEYLTDKETCKYLRCTQEQLADAIAGKHHVGRLTPTLRFEKKEVERYRQALEKAGISFSTGEINKLAHKNKSRKSFRKRGG